jgi:hypothetical protein
LAGQTGIGVLANTFSGDISNTGTISAGVGIDLGALGFEFFMAPVPTLFSVSTFAGNVVNSGAIVATTGINLFDSNISGAIIDTGTIRASRFAISVDSNSDILAGSHTAIDITGTSFTGGIFNAGVISGSAGIVIASVGSVSITDAGAIIGTGGTAIEFAGSGNTLTLEAGYTIGGKVDPQAGSNTLVLGGSGTATFDLSSIGIQYEGFTAFEVTGGTWTLLSASTAEWVRPP